MDRLGDAIPSTDGWLSPTWTWIDYVAPMMGQARSRRFGAAPVGLMLATFIGGCGATHAPPDPAVASCVWGALARQYMAGGRYDCSWNEPNPGPELPAVACHHVAGDRRRCRQDQGPDGDKPRYTAYRVLYDGAGVTYWTSK